MQAASGHSGGKSQGIGRAAGAAALDVAIFGGRGAGALVAFTLDRLAAAGGAACLGFLNDVEPAGTLIGDHPVLGPFAAWHDLPPPAGFIAPLHKANEMARRAKLIRGLGVPRERWATVIDPQALLAGDVSLGVGVFIAPAARVLSSARLGDHVAVRGGCEVSHDTTVEDFAAVGVNSVLCGYVTVREGAHIAPGAVVRDGLTVGRYSVVGLGAVVVRDVPDGAIVAGNPARIIGAVAGFESMPAAAP